MAHGRQVALFLISFLSSARQTSNSRLVDDEEGLPLSSNGMARNMTMLATMRQTADGRVSDEAQEVSEGLVTLRAEWTDESAQPLTEADLQRIESQARNTILVQPQVHAHEDRSDIPLMSSVRDDANGKWVYHVFVRVNIIDYVWTYHTELRICVPKEEPQGFHHRTFEQLVSQVRTDRKIDGDQQRSWRKFLTCRNTGFAYIDFRDQEFDNQHMYHFQSAPGVVYEGGDLVYAGKVEVHKATTDTDAWDVMNKWVQEMAICGNWAPDNYRMLSHNCNTYTSAVLKSFGLRELTEIMRDAGLGSFFSEKRIFNPLLANPGYLDISDWTCKGLRCNQLTPGRFWHEKCRPDQTCRWSSEFRLCQPM